MSENEERLYAKRLISQFQEENERLREENEDHKKQGLELVAEVAPLRARLAEMSGLYENAERVGQGLVARLAESTSRCAALEKAARRSEDIIEAALEVASDHCRGDGGPCDCGLCLAAAAYRAGHSRACEGWMDGHDGYDHPRACSCGGSSSPAPERGEG